MFLACHCVSFFSQLLAPSKVRCLVGSREEQGRAEQEKESAEEGEEVAKNEEDEAASLGRKLALNQTNTQVRADGKEGKKKKLSILVNTMNYSLSSEKQKIALNFYSNFEFFEQTLWFPVFL